MRIVKKIKIIESTDNEVFFESVKSTIMEFQNRHGLEVEVNHSTTHVGENVIFRSAIILGYRPK
jgi:hypothetical protein